MTNLFMSCEELKWMEGGVKKLYGVDAIWGCCHMTKNYF